MCTVNKQPVVKPKVATADESVNTAPILLQPLPAGCHAMSPCHSAMSAEEFMAMLTPLEMESVRDLFLQKVRYLRSFPRAKHPRPRRPESLPVSVSTRMKLLVFHENTRPPYWGILLCNDEH